MLRGIEYIEIFTRNLSPEPASWDAEPDLIVYPQCNPGRVRDSLVRLQFVTASNPDAVGIGTGYRHKNRDPTIPPDSKYGQLLV